MVLKRRILGAMAAVACVALLSSCSLLSDITSDDPSLAADHLMKEIASAAKHHDVAALVHLFSPAARDAAPDLDTEFSYFLSVFPSGAAKWVDPEGGCDGPSEDDAIHSAYLHQIVCDYTATVAGKKYDVGFEDVIEDTADPSFVGVYALAVVPYADATGYAANGAPKPLNLWFGSEGLRDFDLFKGVPSSFIGVPGVYFPGVPDSSLQVSGPPAAVEMQDIADAVKHRDATALKKLFSPDVRAKSSDLDSGVNYFLSVFPRGQLTWKLQGSLSWSMQDNVPACDFSFGYKTAMEELCPRYKVTVNGQDFDVDFVEFSADQPDTDKVGLCALGVAPYIANAAKAPAVPKPFSTWAKSFSQGKYGNPSGAPGVYVPAGAQK